MRPLSLTVEGFTAFKDESRINFEGLQLAVFLGSNGAGKSSLLEAILIALYGMAPRMRSRQIRDYISHGRPQFRIEFEFRLENFTYRVQRRYPRKGLPQVRLEVMQGSEWLTLTDKVEETNRKIESLLRMGYDTFTKAVLLPQNLFDQFLKGDKEKRREVLEELLNLKLFERIGFLAGEKRRGFQEILGQDERLLAELRSRTSTQTLEVTLKKHSEELTRLTEERKSLSEDVSRLEKTQLILKRIATLRSDRDTIKKTLEKTEKEFLTLKISTEKINKTYEQELPGLEKEEHRLIELSKIAADYDRVASEEKSVGGKLSERDKIRVEAEKTLILLRRKREEMTKSLESVRLSRIALEKENDRFERLLVERENLATFSRKREAYAASKAQLEKLQTPEADRHLIQELRAGLSPGDVCPVCAQTVQSVIPAELATIVAAAEAEIAALENELRERLNYPDGDLLIRARDEFSKLKKKNEELKDCRRREDEFVKLLSQFEAQIRKDEEAYHQLDREREGLKALLERLQKEKTLLLQSGLQDNAKETLNNLRKKINDIRVTREKMLQQFHQTEERARQLSLQYDKISEILQAESSNLPGDPIFDEKKLSRAKQNLGELEQSITFHSIESGKIKQQLKEAEEAEEKLKIILERQEEYRQKEILYGTIHQDLQKNRLPDFLYGSVLETLLNLAGERFLDFSQGRYRLALQGTGDIQVLDGWNANEPRPIESLSGGETFSASLAFALALSDYLQGRQQVECLFIDEGFGNLDLETRNKVAEVLALLRRENKLIGIITHIEELADYFPHQIRIEKLPEGSKIREESKTEPGRISEAVT